MTPSYLILTVALLFSQTVNSQSDFKHVELAREPRQVSHHEGSGWDLTNDDEDTETEYGSTNIVSSRVIPIASSPMFNYPGSGPSTNSYRTPGLRSSLPGVRATRGPAQPARPSRLNSYYPDLRTDGSGGGDSVISSIGYHEDSDLISPTRSQNLPGQPSSLVPVIPHQTSSKPANHEPFIGSRLDKVPLTSGKSSRIIIPANTFQDLEDGDTRDLSLRIIDRDTGADIDSLKWATFKTDTQEILSLPLEDNIGIYNFEVVATDSGGKSQQDILVVAVRQYQVSRTFHHEFQASLVMVDPGRWRHPVYWKFSLLDSLVSFFGDSDPSRLTVLEMTETAPGEVKVRWTNDSLPRQSCPKAQIINLYNKMTINERPSQSFKSALRGSFRVKDISLEYRGLCSVRRTDLPPPPPPPSNNYNSGPGYDNSMPQIRNAVDKLNVTAGELLQFQVPEDMCWDKEDGSTRDLNLQLLTLSRLEVDSDNWLQFDTKNQEFIGVPLENDVGREEYQLVCSDNEGYSSIDGIEVTTVSRPFFEKLNLMFTFVFNDTLDDGTKLSRSRVRLMKVLARLFRDKDTRNIVLSKVDPDTLEIAWFNRTHSVRACPVEDINEARRLLLDNEGSVKPGIVQAFLPYFHLTDIKMVNMESCLELENQPTPDTTGDPIFDLLPPQEYIIAFVVPALIIVGMLLLAVLIACILHKKRKAGKLDMYRTEALPPRIPVIMQDELSEDNFNVSKQPIILREEPESYNSYGRPPNYYGSSRMDEEFSECDSLVNGMGQGSMMMGGGNGYHQHHHQPQQHHTLPSHHTPYSRPPPVALEFSDSMARSRHRAAPLYRRQQQFNP